MKGMDFSKFQKVADHKDHAIFRHENGSTLKVAKSGLSEKMKRQMDKIPIKLADGGDSGGDDDSQPQQPININIGAGAAQPQPQAPVDVGGVAKITGQQPGTLPPDQLPKDENGGVQDPSATKPGLAQQVGDWVKNSQWMNPKIDAQGNVVQADAQPAMQSTPGGQVAANGPGLQGAQPPPGADQGAPEAPAPAPKPVTPQEHAAAMSQYLKQEDQNLAHDFDQGHIAPETYKSLFDKKDTLGKIGTIFGMLLSGAGSGLARQPNAVLEMMNKQIQNDLESQKDNISNKQNFLRLNMEQQRTNAEVGNMAMDNKIKAFTLANMQMNRAALHSLTQQVDKLPVGSPQRAQAEQQLAMISQGVQSENYYNLADRAAAASAYMNWAGGQNVGGTQTAQNDIDYNKMNHLERMSQLKMPGAPSSEDIQNMTKEAVTLKESRALRNDFNNAFESLDKQFLAGKLSPHQRESYINSLAGKLAKVSAGRYNAAEAKNQIESMIPKASDWKSTRDIKRSNNNKFFDIEEAGTPTLERFGVKLPAQVPGGSQNIASKPNEIRYDAQGNAYKRGEDGRPVRINQTAAR